MNYVDSLMHNICVWHTNPIFSKFQVQTVTNIEVLKQNVFSHAGVVVIVVGNMHFTGTNYLP